MGGFHNGGVGLGMPVTNTGFGGLSSRPGPEPGLDHGAGAPGITSGGGENGGGMGGMPPGSSGGVTLDMYQSFMHRSGEGGQGQ